MVSGKRNISRYVLRPNIMEAHRKRGDISRVLTHLGFGQRWVWWHARGSSNFKWFELVHRPEWVNLSYCLYYAGILNSFAPSDGVLWKSKAS